MHYEQPGGLFSKVISIYGFGINFGAFRIGENELAVKFCRNAVQKEAETSLESQAVVYNNLSSLYFKHLEWKRAFRAQLKALKLIENQVRNFQLR